MRFVQSIESFLRNLVMLRKKYFTINFSLTTYEADKRFKSKTESRKGTRLRERLKSPPSLQVLGFLL